MLSSVKKIRVVIVLSGAYSLDTSSISSKVSSVLATSTAIIAACFLRVSSVYINASFSKISPSALFSESSNYSSNPRSFSLNSPCSFKRSFRFLSISSRSFFK